MKQLVSMKEMITDAFQKHYAVPQININNLEWVQAILKQAQKDRSPVILGVSMGAKKYMGSYKLIRNLVLDTMQAYEIDIPVALHLDHGDFENVKEATDEEFSSIMYDGSKLSFEENLKLSQAVSKMCKEKNLSLEIEVGPIGGYEDGISTQGEKADVNQCLKMIEEVELDVLAASIGNIHGLYPKNWEGLDFKLLEEIASKTKKPLVLHGGSGIDDLQVKKAISLGVSKVNVNTECQVAFTEALLDYFSHHHDLDSKKTYDPRNYLKEGMEAIQKVCHEKFLLFGSINRY